MANLVQIGGGGTLFVGEDKTLRFECIDQNGLPVDMTGWDSIFDVRAKDKSPDPAIVSKSPFLVGSFNDVRALNTQRMIVQLFDDDMNLFKEKVYRYSWKRLDNGLETVLAWGNFSPQKATAA